MISSILLAAGESKRMENENKLVKEVNGISILKYAVKNILGSSIDELIIVLGHEKEIVENIIENIKDNCLVLVIDMSSTLVIPAFFNISDFVTPIP